MRSAFLCLFCLLLTSTLHAQTKDAVGVIIEFEGAAMATSEDASRNLALQSSVYAKDQIITGKKSRLLIELEDGAKLLLGSNTEMLIQDYASAKDPNRSGILSVFQGAFHMASGKLAKLGFEKFKVNTPVATIGVKGTQFWGGLWDQGKWDFALLDGKGVVVSNDAGSVELNTVGEGTTILAPGQAPTEPKMWEADKVKRALKTVGLE